MTAAISPRPTHSSPAPAHHLTAIKGGAPAARGARMKPPSLRDSLRTIGEAQRKSGHGSIRHTRFTQGDLYAALTHMRLARVSPRAADEFALRLRAVFDTVNPAKRSPSISHTTDKIVTALVREGFITKESKHEIHALAYERSRFSGGASGEAYPTVDLKGALELVRSHETTAAPPPEKNHSSWGAPSLGAPPAAPKGPSIGIAAPFGFLWKPISDSDGMLAILLPEALTGEAAAVEVLSPDGRTVLATGRPAGIGNGGRAHFRFDRSGGSFPAGCVVRITLQNGSTQKVTIPAPTMRNEGRGG